MQLPQLEEAVEHLFSAVKLAGNVTRGGSNEAPR
jgi:hypothetical protein